MIVKVWSKQDKFVEFNDVIEVHINLSKKVGPRTEQIISPETIAIEQKDNGFTYRLTDIEEIEILREDSGGSATAMSHKAEAHRGGGEPLMLSSGGRLGSREPAQSKEGRRDR